MILHCLTINYYKCSWSFISDNELSQTTMILHCLTMNYHNLWSFFVCQWTIHNNHDPSLSHNELSQMIMILHCLTMNYHKLWSFIVCQWTNPDNHDPSLSDNDSLQMPMNLLWFYCILFVANIHVQHNLGIGCHVQQHLCIMEWSGFLTKVSGGGEREEGNLNSKPIKS